MRGENDYEDKKQLQGENLFWEKKWGRLGTLVNNIIYLSIDTISLWWSSGGWWSWAVVSSHPHAYHIMCPSDDEKTWCGVEHWRSSAVPKRVEVCWWLCLERKERTSGGGGSQTSRMQLMMPNHEPRAYFLLLCPNPIIIAIEGDVYDDHLYLLTQSILLLYIL